MKSVEEYGISITSIGKMIDTLCKRGETMGSRDDVIRLIELITAEERMEKIKRIQNL